MGLDFDAIEYCKNVKLQQAQPPYACPVVKCDRSYKTVVGLQYHLLNYDHDNPQPITPIITPHRKKARKAHSTPKAPKGTADDNGANGGGYQVANPESLVSYNDEEQTVQFNIDGKSVRLAIDEPLPFIEGEEYAELVARRCILNADAPPLEENATWARVKVPEAHYHEIEDYHVPDAPPRPLAYYRFIEKSAEELDGEIEYDVDEEDSAWLEWMNEQREKAGFNPVTIDTMELLMDRLEKESYFQAAANGTPTGVEVDDDAVCCICMDGECQNTNVILFCDMCNLAVHQDCYGVPFIPEGQWLCRRCLQSPSTPVSCVLCPNAGGAFKQTDRGQWAHVVCALWIPEVRFANTVFLEPIDSIETIPAARWRLTCYVCKEKGLGACIQCQRNSCYAAFHVTCAQQAGLYMTMDTVKDGHNDSSVHVQKYAYCHAHTPADAKLKTNQKEVEDTRMKMKEARKALAKKRSTAPIVLIPTIPPNRVQEISGMVHMQKKQQFLDRLIAYWTLKRQYRNGVPLLRRLQSQGNNHGVIHRNGSPDTKELYKQLKYWQCLRQDLERARLLCELVRKREKLKAAFVKICEQVVMLQVNPLESALTKLLDTLEAKDTSEIFREPVDTEEVPDYLDIVKHPMDLGTMRTKLKQGQYATLEQLEIDFDLMIQNCLAYNNKDTVFYRAGIRMRDQAAPLFQQVRKELQREGLLDHTRSDHEDHVEHEVEVELKTLLEAKPCEEIVQKLLILADKSQVLKNPMYRTKKIKQIRLEITRMRKAMQKAKIAARHSNVSVHSQSDDDDDDEDEHSHDVTLQAEKILKQPSCLQLQQQQVQNSLSKRSRKVPANMMVVDDDDTMGEESKETATTTVQTPPCSPIKSLNNSASPVGVNRRTAVLFTRKAQAALKRPSEITTPVKDETTTLTASATQNNNNTTTSGASAAGAAAAATLASSAMTISNKLSGSHLAPLSASLGLPAGAVLGGTVAGKSPKRNARHKRLSEMRQSASMSPKKSPNATLTPNTPSTVNVPASVGVLTTTPNYDRIPDSFRVYRANNERDVSDSDDDDLSDMSGSPCSSCSGFSVSGSGSEYDSSDDDDDEDDDGEDDGEGDAEGDEESEDDEEVDGRDGDVEVNEVASICEGDIDGEADVAGGNGEAISASADSDDGAEESNDRVASDKVETDTKSVATRTPTPSEKRPRNATRTKQKNKPIIEVNANTKNTITNAVQTTTNTAKTKTTTTGTATATASTTTTRSNNKQILTRSATPTASISATSTPIANNVRGRKASLNNKLIYNNTHNTRGAAAATPTPSTSSRPTSANADLVNEAGDADADDALAATAATITMLKPPLEPLQLVWAKCRGYPWYPALILDPKTPKGFVYNGVPLPAPPPDVLALRKNYTEDVVFLVLFFDVKRTWQWLPANKLEILGIDKRLDQQKLVESRKPTERKAVKKAYQDALHYQSQVSDLEGQGPDPIM
ncbi:bromodomain-containing protein homolog isoform X2 [Bactrocera neohumeralis]|uniref:bromodomain-containing protein homolog isoform X2 n=1 Tax=Bactrocera neohumeralis TaxID=98809 RepID=UPI00216516DE|nr:bromodomain-containing protein homolog isoform X2 [Bactrocera neohumeralis]